MSARGPRLHPRSHLGRLHPAGFLSLRSAFGMLRRCRYLWRLIPAPASNTKPVIGPRRALAPRSDRIIDWSTPVSMTCLALRFVVVSAPRGGATVTVTERCEWACCAGASGWSGLKRSIRKRLSFNTGSRVSSHFFRVTSKFAPRVINTTATDSVVFRLDIKL